METTKIYFSFSENGNKNVLGNRLLQTCGTFTKRFDIDLRCSQKRFSPTKYGSAAEKQQRYMPPAVERT